MSDVTQEIKDKVFDFVRQTEDWSQIGTKSARKKFEADFDTKLDKTQFNETLQQAIATVTDERAVMQELQEEEQAKKRIKCV